MDVNKLNYSSVEKTMDERGIRIEDILAVVAYGEAEGGKLISGNSNLAKKRLDKVTVYVQYNNDGTVEDVYSHLVAFASED